MILNATTKKVQILLRSAVTANQCPVVVDYVDFSSTATTPGLQLSNSNSTTAVDIVSAPAASTQRKVNLITVCNKDTVVVVVTIRLNDNGTTYNYLSGLVLPPNCTLQFTDMDGWSVLNPDGSICQSTLSGAAVDVQSYTSSGTWTKPASASFVQIDAVGGGGLGTVNTPGCCCSTNYGGGGGGGSRNQFLMLASEILTSTVTVTVGAQNGGISSFGAYLYGYGGGAGGAGGNGVGSGASQGPLPAVAANQADGTGPVGGFSSYMGGGGLGAVNTPGCCCTINAGGGGGGGSRNQFLMLASEILASTVTVTVGAQNGGISSFGAYLYGYGGGAGGGGGGGGSQGPLPAVAANQADGRGAAGGGFSSYMGGGGGANGDGGTTGGSSFFSAGGGGVTVGGKAGGSATGGGGGGNVAGIGTIKMGDGGDVSTAGSIPGGGGGYGTQNGARGQVWVVSW